MQISVFIPIIVGLINRKRLDQFGIFILFTLLSSLISDTIGTITAFTIQSSVVVQFWYTIGHTILIGVAWHRVREYGRRARLFILISTLVAMLLIIIFWYLSIDVAVVGYINLAFSLILGLFYYYSKFFKSNISDFLLEPKFIIASAFILYCLSVMVIFGAVNFVEPNQVPPIWTLKQIFYVIFNIIIAYGLSMYGKKNIKKWIQES